MYLRLVACAVADLERVMRLPVAIEGYNLRESSLTHTKTFVYIARHDARTMNGWRFGAIPST